MVNLLNRIFYRNIRVVIAWFFILSAVGGSTQILARFIIGISACPAMRAFSCLNPLPGILIETRVYFFKYIPLKPATGCCYLLSVISPFLVKLPQNNMTLTSRLILRLDMAPVTGQDSHVCLVLVL